MRRGFAVLSAVCALVGCSGGENKVGTNTNWMVPCDRQADCGDELSCLCGRCTEECENDADCPSGFSCTNDAAARLECQGETSQGEATRTCQPDCLPEVGCGDGRTCQHGVCVDPLPPKSCTDDALFCEDFETDIDEVTEVITSGNAAQRRRAPSPSGEYLLEATVQAAPSVAYLRGDFAPQSVGELYLSGWVRVPMEAIYDASPLAFWSTNDEAWALRLVIKDGRLGVWTDTTPIAGPFDLVAGAWHCLGARIQIGDVTQGSVELSVDGELLTTSTDVNTLPMGGIDAVAMGVLWAGTPVTMQVDRVVLSASPIDCYAP